MRINELSQPVSDLVSNSGAIKKQKLPFIVC